MSPLVYTIVEAAEALRVSPDTIRRAIRCSDPAAWPPPMKARRQGPSSKAKYVIDAEELPRWREVAFPAA